ncbi:MAG: AAA family ATPase [Candidatus Hatepunaea meridiana]|nr:AAA family ATPase [Candidatus Hatepunaea meridiana]
MIQSIHLENFKSFKDATLELGPFSVLVGANAAGKSNLIDAFKFLHGLTLGYRVPEVIIGVETNTKREWEGIRGGIKGITRHKSRDFAINTCFFDSNKANDKIIHNIRIEAIPKTKELFIIEDSFYKDDELQIGKEPRTRSKSYLSSLPMPLEDDDSSKIVIKPLKLRFYDFFPRIMGKRSSYVSFQSLYESGRNISAVLYRLLDNNFTKNTLIGWLRELTPMDAIDIDFHTDELTGEVMLLLKEADGTITPASSASDGTLRFLGFLAALFDTSTDSILFFEELENGIHPSRLHLITQLIEQTVKQRKIQVIATTHSPLLLGYLSEETIKNSSLLYRLEGRDYTQIKRINDIPDAVRLIKKFGLMDLHMSSWFENTVSCLDDEDED